MKRSRLSKNEADRAEQAAIAAGYSPKSARAIGCRLLRRPEIQARMKYLLKHPEQITGNNENSRTS
jgi:phage terminase small subunit